MPPQAAPQSGQASTASSPSLSPIPQYRLRLFVVGVAERLREAKASGVSEAEILSTIRTERLALAEALSQENFRDAFARAYEQAHNAVMPAAHVSAEEARRATDEIIAHRVNDARWLAELVTHEEFVAKARTTTEVKPEPYQLPSEKVAEMASRFAADGSSYGLDARVHNQHSMEGHRIGHLALAQVYADNGPLHAVLEQNLTHALGGDAAGAKRLASDWLEARRKPAIATADTLGVGGEVYQQVMQRSNAPQPIKLQAQASAPEHFPVVPTAATGLLAGTALTPRVSEENKTRQQKAEDVIYTLNHALTCLSITDLLVMPTVNGVLGTMFGKSAPKFGCAGHGHDGHHHHHDDHHHHGHSPWDELKAPFRKMRDWVKSDAPLSEKLKSIGSNTKNWLISEAAGDVGAVAPTIVLQRFAPGFMEGIRNTVEPVVGKWFKHGAEKAARQWADKHGIDRNSQECVDRAKELYEYEVRHLPQMAIWTLSSIGISWGTMKVLSPEMRLGEFARTKIVGAGVTAGLVMGARAFSPNAAHGWDQGISKNIIVPTTKILGKPFGVKDEDVDKFMKRHEDKDGPELQGRVNEASTPMVQTA